jgi:hypothetical protein
MLGKVKKLSNNFLVWPEMKSQALFLLMKSTQWQEIEAMVKINHQEGLKLNF